MQLLRRLWLAKREESQAFLAAIAQPFLDRQAIALRLRNLLALLVEEHLIDQSLGLAPAERLGDLARLDAAVGQVLAIHLVIDAQCDPAHPPFAFPLQLRAAPQDRVAARLAPTLKRPEKHP